jgi:hypothetical protein
MTIGIAKKENLCKKICNGGECWKEKQQYKICCEGILVGAAKSMKENMLSRFTSISKTFLFDLI